MKNDYKCIVATWLFKTDLSNLNAGEGGSNLTEIKSYKNGLPYISGQSVRHALRKAIHRENPDAFKCTVESPCGDIKECWLCDIFGYLVPGEGSKRWSPLKVSPAMGQIKSPITADMILRLVNEIECPNCHKKINPLWGREPGEKGIEQGKKLKCPECNKEFKAPYNIRQAIAYRQIIENTYRVSVSIDINALGIEEVPNINYDEKPPRLNGTNYIDRYGENSETERFKRLEAIMTAIANMSDFANQSRGMTSCSPDAILISLQKQYNQRLSSALEMDVEGNVNKDAFEVILKDCLMIEDTEIFAGFVPGIIKNDKEIKQVLEDKEISISNSPREAIMDAIKTLRARQ